MTRCPLPGSTIYRPDGLKYMLGVARRIYESGGDDTSTKPTTIVIDEAKLAGVKRVLGTRTLRETVDRSFDEVLARAARERTIARLQKMEGLDLDKPEVMANAWR